MPNWYHGSSSLITKFTLNHSRTCIDLGPGVYFANNSQDAYPERSFTYILKGYGDYPAAYYEMDNNDPEWFHDDVGNLITEIPIDKSTGLRMMGTFWNYRCGNPNIDIKILGGELTDRIKLLQNTVATKSIRTAMDTYLLADKTTPRYNKLKELEGKNQDEVYDLIVSWI